MGGAALASPQVVALNWYIAQTLATVQFFYFKRKLKMVDGLDIDQIRQKDQELKAKMNNGQSMVNPDLKFDFDQTSGNIKVQEEPIYLKNERQKQFLESYGNDQ